MEIGRQIKALRLRRGITQEALAQHLGVTTQAVSKWENKHMKMITCEFNMDSGCVELRFDDGAASDIDCTAIENKYGHTIQQRSELD